MFACIVSYHFSLNVRQSLRGGFAGLFDQDDWERNTVALPFLQQTIVFNVASKFIGNFQKLSVDRAAKLCFSIELHFWYSVPNRCLIFLSSSTSLEPAVFVVELKRVHQLDIVLDSRVIHASLNASEKFDFE